MNLRSDERLIEIMLAKIDHVQKCSKRVCRMGLGGGSSQPRELMYLKTARCVCSLSSPLTTQEKRPKDSVPERQTRETEMQRVRNAMKKEKD